MGGGGDERTRDQEWGCSGGGGARSSKEAPVSSREHLLSVSFPHLPPLCGITMLLLTGWGTHFGPRRVAGHSPQPLAGGNAGVGPKSIQDFYCYYNYSDGDDDDDGEGGTQHWQRHLSAHLQVRLPALALMLGILRFREPGGSGSAVSCGKGRISGRRVGRPPPPAPNVLPKVGASSGGSLGLGQRWWESETLWLTSVNKPPRHPPNPHPGPPKCRKEMKIM